MTRLAADYPFLDVLWSILIFMAFILWIWLAITCFMDIFRRRDTGGFAKALWIIFIIVLPYLGVLVYLIANHTGMAERQAAVFTNPTSSVVLPVSFISFDTS